MLTAERRSVPGPILVRPLATLAVLVVLRQSARTLAMLSEPAGSVTLKVVNPPATLLPR